MIELSFGGVSLLDYADTYTQKGSRPMLASPIDYFASIPTRDGGYHWGKYYEKKRFSLPCVINFTDRDDLITKIQLLSGVFDTKGGFKQLILSDQDDRYYLAKLEQNIDVDMELGTFTLNLVCATPFGISTTLTSSSHAIAASPQTVTENPGGSVFVEPVITLTATGASPVIIVNNATSGEQLTWGGTLAIGEVLVINSELWLVTYQGNPSMANVSGRLPSLQPSVLNSFNISNFTGTLVFTYRARYL